MINWFAHLLAHLLMVGLITAAPVTAMLQRLDLRQHQRWRPPTRLRVYLRYIGSQWAAMLLLFIMCSGLGWSPQTLGLRIPSHLFLSVGVTLFLFLVLSLLSLSLRRDLRNPKKQDFWRKRLDHVLPVTRQERLLYIPVCITAGICEELLFRGFMPAYLMHIFPGFPFLLALVCSACVFGLGHMRQGVAGMVMSTIMGLLWGFFYFFTGSIFFPILIHAFSDLRLLLIGPIESENVAAQSEEKPSAVLS